MNVRISGVNSFLKDNAGIGSGSDKTGVDSGSELEKKFVEIRKRGIGNKELETAKGKFGTHDDTACMLITQRQMRLR
jgi:hypothetical protein